MLLVSSCTFLLSKKSFSLMSTLDGRSLYVHCPLNPLEQTKAWLHSVGMNTSLLFQSASVFLNLQENITVTRKVARRAQQGLEESSPIYQENNPPFTVL